MELASGHGARKNRLYWVKDVVLNEDNSTICRGNAPAEISIIRAIAVNICSGHSQG